MKLIKPSFEILSKIDGSEILKNIELAGRTCYKSEDKITEDSSKQFVQNILKRGHESVIEHEKVTVRIICDRGVSHEIVRHRLASYSQESTRYCNYSKDRFNNQISYIQPNFWANCPESDKDCEKHAILETILLDIEKAYNQLIELGAVPQEARCILPNLLKTEIVVTMNLREWRHFFKLRTSKAAHPQMREVACPLLDEFKRSIPIIFDDITYE